MDKIHDGKYVGLPLPHRGRGEQVLFAVGCRTASRKDLAFLRRGPSLFSPVEDSEDGFEEPNPYNTIIQDRDLYYPGFFDGEDESEEPKGTAPP